MLSVPPQGLMTITFVLEATGECIVERVGRQDDPAVCGHAPLPRVVHYQRGGIE